MVKRWDIVTSVEDVGYCRQAWSIFLTTRGALRGPDVKNFTSTKSRKQMISTSADKPKIHYTRFHVTSP